MTRERIAALPADDWRQEKNPHYQEPLLSREPEPGGAARRDRVAARRHARRGGDRVGAAPPGGHRRDRRRRRPGSCAGCSAPPTSGSPRPRWRRSPASGLNRRRGGPGKRQGRRVNQGYWRLMSSTKKVVVSEAVSRDLEAEADGLPGVARQADGVLGSRRRRACWRWSGWRRWRSPPPPVLCQLDAQVVVGRRAALLGGSFTSSSCS